MISERPFHPGEILAELYLRPLGESQESFAQRLGWPRARLNEILRGRRGVSAHSALDLAELLGTSPEMWMNLQSAWELDRARQERAA